LDRLVGRDQEIGIDVVAEQRDPLEKVHQVFVQPEADDVVGFAEVDLRVELAGRALDLAGGYDRWARATDALLVHLPDADRSAILDDNARRFYGLDV